VSGARDFAGNLINSSFDEATFNGIGVAPRVSSATVTGINTIRVVFNEGMADGSGTTALTRAANYSFTSPEGFPISSDSVSKINSTTVDITTIGTMETGTNNYRATVINVKDAAGNTIDPSFDDDLFDGVGLPFLLSAVPTNNSTIRATFDVNMSDAGLTTNGNYAFTCPAGAVIAASLVTKITAKIVDITISGEMKIGFENYTLTLSNLTGALGGTIELGNYEDDFSGIGTSPTVSSATAINPTTVQVQFSENMADAGLTTNGNYAFTCPAGAVITVGSVARVGGSSSAVNISVSGEMRLGFDNYTLTVTLSSVTDTVGNPILASNTDTFNGNGIKPQLDSAVDVDEDTIDLTFDSEVDETTAENADNYTVAGAGSPDVSTATKTAATTVRLALATSMTQGTVTVTVSQNVTDLVGNPMDAGASADSFDVDYAGPTLQSVAIVDHGHLPSEYTIELTFDENLKDEAAVTTEANYTITGPARGYPAYNPDTAVFGATHNKVQLTVNKELCNGESYTIECINLHDEGDHALVDGTANFTGAEGAKPALVDFDGVPGSYVVNTVTILLQFSEALRDYGAIENYSVLEWPDTTPVEIVSVTSASSTTVTLIVRWDTPLYNSEYYTVIVGNDHVCDLAGNYVEPLMDTILLPGAPPP
jgi:hypothetical protein